MKLSILYEKGVKLTEPKVVDVEYITQRNNNMQAYYSYARNLHDEGIADFEIFLIFNVNSRFDIDEGKLVYLKADGYEITVEGGKHYQEWIVT